MAATIPATFFSSKDSIRRSREQFILEMKSSAQFCIQLCNETDLVNPLLITLLYNYNLLVSVMMGDTSVTLWRLHGDLVCGATALGLHRESPKTKSEISLALEIRRRAHAAVFGFDKAHASFTGRPITLPRRYCTAVLPLDLPDEDLLLPNDELRKKAGEELDENGWNTRGAVYPATTLRVFYLMALIREEILELNLATTDEDLDAARILDLKDRALQQYEAFPSMLKYQAGEIETAKSDPTLWSRACTRLRYVQNIYLIERLLQKTGYSNGQELLETAKESLGLCLKFYVYRDTFAEHQFDFEWMVSPRKWRSDLQACAFEPVLTATDHVLRSACSRCLVSRTIETIKSSHEQSRTAETIAFGNNTEPDHAGRVLGLGQTGQWQLSTLPEDKNHHIDCFGPCS